MESVRRNTHAEEDGKGKTSLQSGVVVGGLEPLRLAGGVALLLGGHAVGDGFDTLLGGLGLLLLDEVVGGLLLGGRAEEFLEDEDADGSRDDEEHHHEAGVALARGALGPRVVLERFIGAE